MSTILVGFTRGQRQILSLPIVSICRELIITSNTGTSIVVIQAEIFTLKYILCFIIILHHNINWLYIYIEMSLFFSILPISIFIYFLWNYYGDDIQMHKYTISMHLLQLVLFHSVAFIIAYYHQSSRIRWMARNLNIENESEDSFARNWF